MRDLIYPAMGASNHSKEERAELDYYATDPIAVKELLELHPELVNPDWKYLDCCAGGGAIMDAFYEITGIQMNGIDIMPRRQDIIVDSYMNVDCKDKYNCIITNFPYGEATKSNPVGFSELLIKLIEDVKDGGYVCSFQKLLQLESAKRYQKIYSKYKPQYVYVYASRRNCYKNGDTAQKQSAVCYTWTIFHKGYGGETILRWIP